VRVNYAHYDDGMAVSLSSFSFVCRSYKPEFHGTSFPRSILVTFSRECIVRVGRVGDDVTRMLRERYEETAVVEFRL